MNVLTPLAKLLLKLAQQQREKGEKELAELYAKLAREGRLFLCECGEKFDSLVWHCPMCAHHWPMSRAECWNCHKGKRSRGPKAKKVEPETTSDAP